MAGARGHAPHGRIAVRPCVFLYPLPYGIFYRTPSYGNFATIIPFGWGVAAVV